MLGLLKLSKDIKKLLFIVASAAGIALGEGLALNIVIPEVKRYIKKLRKKSKNGIPKKLMGTMDPDDPSPEIAKQLMVQESSTIIECGSDEEGVVEVR